MIPRFILDQSGLGALQSQQKSFPEILNTSNVLLIKKKKNIKFISIGI